MKFGYWLPFILWMLILIGSGIGAKGDDRVVIMTFMAIGMIVILFLIVTIVNSILMLVHSIESLRSDSDAFELHIVGVVVNLLQLGVIGYYLFRSADYGVFQPGLLLIVMFLSFVQGVISLGFAPTEKKEGRSS